MAPIGPEGKKTYRQAVRLGAVGIEMGLSVAVGVFLGIYADKWLDSAPYCTMFGLFIGIAAGFKRLYQIAKQQSSENAHDD